MNYSNLEFKTKTASVQSLADHLGKCSNSFDPPLHTYVDIEVYSNKIKDHAVTFEAWADDLLVGLVAVYYNDFESKTGFITNVSVLPQFYKKGIAIKLLISSLKYGVSSGFMKVKLEVNDKNAPAISLYSRNGFSLIEKKGDMFVMERILKNG